MRSPKIPTPKPAKMTKPRLCFTVFHPTVKPKCSGRLVNVFIDNRWHNTVALLFQQTSCPWLWVPFKHPTENISTPPAWHGQTCLLQTVKHELLVCWFLILACQSSSRQRLMTTQPRSDGQVSFYFLLNIPKEKGQHNKNHNWKDC